MNLGSGRERSSNLDSMNSSISAQEESKSDDDDPASSSEQGNNSKLDYSDIEEL